MALKINPSDSDPKPPISRKARGSNGRSPRNGKVQLTELQLERNRIAKRLHDGPSQTLCAAQFIALILEQRAKEQNNGGAECLETELFQILRNAIDEMHEIVRELRG